jgi:hypothetical protein
MTMTTQQAEERAVKIITSLDDIALVDTPVKYLAWTRDGHKPKIRHELRACLFQATDRIAYRPATVVTCGAYGQPIIKTGRLISAVVQPRPGGGRSPWELHVGLVEPGNRNPIGFDRDFPVAPVLLMWGKHEISLADLTALCHWHSGNFAAAWREVARRCHATGQIWLDTVAAAIEDHAARHSTQQEPIEAVRTIEELQTIAARRTVS